MISDHSMEMTRKIDDFMERRFEDHYTLRVTHWNDGDFRIVAYCLLDSRDEAMPGEMRKVFTELWYQDSKMPDGVAMMGNTGQDSDKPRDCCEQYDVGEPERVDLDEAVPPRVE